MKILNPNKLKTIDYRTVKDLQENLKDLSTENHDKLLNVLTKRGFDIPLHIWFEKDTPYIVDGHQRVRVMKINELNDEGSFEVPYIEVKAKDRREAVERLLEVTSQYGTMTVDGLDELSAMYELDTDNLDINFDAINIDNFYSDNEKEEEKPEKKEYKDDKFTIADLRMQRVSFAADTGHSDNGFVDWLEKNQ